MSIIHPYIENYAPKDYGDADFSGCELDCSLGVSGWPLPPEVTERLAEIPASELKNYPHNPALLAELTEALLARFRPAAPFLTAENIHFGCGSYDLLCGINRLYAGPGRSVFGHAPQFTAYVDHVRCIGARYEAYPLDPACGYRLDAGAFADAVRRAPSSPALICCENPNNPTGQALAPGAAETLIAAARDTGAAVVFDEAYGDYLAPEESAAALIAEGERAGVDVFVTRSFSKGYGMAGIRLGYALGPRRAMAQLRKLVLLFDSSAPARQLAAAMLAARPDYPAELRARTREANEFLYPRIAAAGKYRMAETSVYTPICTLYAEEKSVDLCRALARAGIAAVSGRNFGNLGQNAVRLMLCDDLPRLAELLARAEF